MTTRVFRMAEGRLDEPALDEAARILREGGIVAFPTETVYGLAANAANPSALERLKALKDRPPASPFSHHISRKEDLPGLVDRIPPRAERLIARYWPGPLTLVLDDGKGRTVGVRHPAHAVARALLARAGVPVVAPSANLRGDTPAATADEVLQAFEGRIDAVVDGGPADLKQASTVVRVRGCGFQVLREGIITEADVRALLSATLLFVCTGNSCRSPMAEGLLKKALADRCGVLPEALEDQGFRILSAGVSALPGAPATAEAIGVMADRGVDLRPHVATPLTPRLVQQASAIYAMAPRHVEALLEIEPEGRGKIRLLDPEERPIADPIGGPLVEYRVCADHIERCVKAIADAM